MDECGVDRSAYGGAVDRRILLALAAIGLLLVLMSIPRIISGAFILAYEPVIRLIQHNGELPTDRLLAAQSAYESALAWHGGAEERSALASLRRRSGLVLGADTAAGHAFLESAGKQNETRSQRHRQIRISGRSWRRRNASLMVRRRASPPP